MGKEARLHVHEALNETDSELTQAIAVYDEELENRDTAIAGSEFRKAFQPDGLYYRVGYCYHLWTIRHEGGAKCEGMASFLTMPSAGFGGYIGFLKPLRGSGKLRYLAARMEERMVRDGTRARGWYIECGSRAERDIFVKLGFRELDVDYMQPSLPGRNIDPPTRSLHLLYKPFGRVYASADDTTAIPKSAFLQAVREIYQSIYGIPNPDEHQAFIKLADSLGSAPDVKTKPLLSTT